jgi:parallel beta-helix repeat protein
MAYTPIVNVMDYGAVGDGTTDDTAAIQSALNAAGTMGGAIVYLPGLTFYCANTLSVPSNTWVRGAGLSAVLKGPVGARAGIVIAGVHCYAALGSIGTTGVRISDLTVDNQANGTLANGIVMGGTGATTNDFVVERCQCLGYDAHEYMIWSVGATQGKIRDNIIIGNAAAGSSNDEEGIEVYGGQDIECCGNTIIGCAARGISIAESTADSTTTLNQIWVHHNYISAGVWGIYFTIQTAGRDFHFSDNIILNQQNSSAGSNAVGITCAALSTTTISGLVIRGNIIRGVQGQGITLNGSASGLTAEGTVVADNVIEDMTSGSPCGILEEHWPGVTCEGNVVKNISYVGIYFQAGSNSTIQDNDVTVGASAVAIYGDGNEANLVVKDNRLLFGSCGVTMTAGVTALVSGNTFQYTGSEVKPINVPATVFRAGNALGYYPSLSNPFGTGWNMLNGCEEAPVTFAGLPATPAPGMLMPVSDSTVTAWHATISAGGGANQVIARRTTSAWIVSTYS